MTAVQRPVSGPVRPYEFPVAHRASLPNGLRLIVAPMPRLPLVTVLALVDAGAVRDPRGREGVAALTARALDEGTGDLDGAAVTERFEHLGTTFEGSVDWDSSVARFTATSSRLDDAFALFAEVLRHPSFPERDVARLRDERLADLEHQLTEPRELADERFTGFLFSPASRYSRSAGGTSRSVSGLDAADIRAFHTACYGPTTTTLVVVGDVTPGRIAALVARGFGSWRNSTAPSEAIAPSPATVASEGRRTVVVAKPGAPQSELRVGHLGIPRSHPDYLATVVMNAILGGLFSSRINLNLRERHAFTYGASSTFEWRRNAGPFEVSTAVKSEVTDRAVEEILREIDLMRVAPPAAAEVELATEYLAGVFPIRYESTAAVAAALAGATVFALPEDWFVSYRDRVRAISRGEVHAAARAHLEPGRMLVLAVGDPAVISAPLARLAIGELATHPSDFDPAEGS